MKEVFHELSGTIWLAVCLSGVVLLIVVSVPLILWHLSRIGKEPRRPTGCVGGDMEAWKEQEVRA